MYSLANRAALGLTLLLAGTFGPGCSKSTEIRGKSGGQEEVQLRREPLVAPGFEPDLQKKGQFFEGIYLDPNIPDEVYCALAKDIHSLRTMKIADPLGKIKDFLHVSEVTGETLLAWLTERVKYVLKGTYGMHSSVPNTPENDFAAANLGYRLLSQSYGNRSPVAFPIPGLRPIEVKSLRAGVVILGRQMQNPEVTTMPQTESRKRLAILFHEGRHSDGRDESIAFTHAICPEGHSLAGSNFCDSYGNGAYAIQGHILRGMLEACDECSEEGKKWGMKDVEKILDRVLHPEEEADDAPQMVPESFWEPRFQITARHRA